MGNKKTIEDMQALADTRGGVCLSLVYVRAMVKLRWRCANGHEWESRPNDVQSGYWCPFCAGRLLWAPGKSEEEARLEECQAVARKKAGECLSTSYRNNNTKLRWRCYKGHEWMAVPSSIKQGQWCPCCSGKQVWSPGSSQAVARLAECRSIAGNMGGLFLSSAYCGAKGIHRWRCDEGHEWDATPDSIKQGSWCPVCSGKKRGSTQRGSLAGCIDLAKARGGKCISESYVNIGTKLRWRCEVGHEWDASPNSIQQGSWCPFCDGQRTWSPGKTHTEASLEEYVGLARRRGGECLSDTYVSSQTKLHWRCADGHEWQATPGSIKQGQWCPYCSFGLNEELCRGILERLTGKSWPKAKPTWLKNSRGNRMELDGFCQELGVAFEYHGGQHFTFVPAFHKTTDRFERRKADDGDKRRLCQEQGIPLIEIPFTVEADGLIAFLTGAMKDALGREVPVPPDLSMDGLGYDRGKLVELHALASGKGGECLSRTYRGSSQNHRWRCSEGHEWVAKHGHIAKGVWCPYCAGRLLWRPGMSSDEARLEECREAAQKMGGTCLSDSYVNDYNKLRWRCSDGHEWEALPGPIKLKGVWCPKCRGKRIWETRRSKGNLDSA